MLGISSKALEWDLRSLESETLDLDLSSVGAGSAGSSFCFASACGTKAVVSTGAVCSRINKRFTNQCVYMCVWGGVAVHTLNISGTSISTFPLYVIYLMHNHAFNEQRSGCSIISSMFVLKVQLCNLKK